MTFSADLATARWNTPLRVVVIGCGAVTQQYYRPTLEWLQGRGGISTVELYDPQHSVALALEHGWSQARALSQWQNVVDCSADLAFVASPPRFHAQQVQELLLSGKHVLCEKPFTLDYSSAVELVELAERQQLVCAVGMVRRFARLAAWMRGFIQAADGPPTSIHWTEGGPFRWPVASTGYFAPSAGNGLLWDLGAHIVDLLVWWLGTPSAVACRDDAAAGTEANLELELTYPQTAVHVRLSRDCPVLPEIRWQRRGEVLAVEDLFATQMRWRPESGTPGEWLVGELQTSSLATNEPLTRGAASFAEAFLQQLVNVRNAIVGDEPLHVPARSVLPSLQILTTADRLRQPLDLPWLSSTEKDQILALRAGADGTQSTCDSPS